MISGQLNSRLARCLALTIVLVSSAITLILTMVQLYGTYRTEVDGIQTVLDQLEQIHVKSLTQSLWAANEKDLKIQLDGIIQIPQVQFAQVSDASRMWQQAGKLPSGNTLERTFPLTYFFRGSPQRIGEFHVVSSLNVVYRQLWDEAIGVLLRNGLKTFLVAAFMLWFFHRRINQHLLQITEHLKNIEFDKEPQPIKLNRSGREAGDEFDELCENLNLMQQTLYEKHLGLKKNSEMFHAIADYTIDWEGWYGPDGNLLWLNPSVERITGYTVEQCFAMVDFPLPIVSDKAERDRLSAALIDARAATTVENLEFGILCADGTRLMMASSWQPVYDSAGVFAGFRISNRDITHLKAVERKLEERVDELHQARARQRELLVLSEQEKARLISLLEAMKLGILFVDPDNTIVYVNSAFRHIWRLPPNKDWLGNTGEELAQDMQRNLMTSGYRGKEILPILQPHEISSSLEITTRDGKIIQRTTHVVLDNQQDPVGRIWIHEDVTEERKTAEQLLYLAQRDSLTGLYNRHYFQNFLERTLARQDDPQHHCALLLFDLDEFKYINDTFGHQAGDEVLVRIAGSIRSILRQNELIARIGGDEFALLLPRANRKDAIALAERILRTTAGITFCFQERELRLTNSIGIALYPDHGMSAEELIAAADSAMYQAKDAGKNGFSVYSPDLANSREMLQRMNWREILSAGLERDCFQLWFQGIYRTSDLKISHLEALIRLPDHLQPDRMIMPGEFIPPAEKTGMILAIDRWVIATSIQTLAQHPQVPSIAINLSGRSFDDPSLPDFIAGKLLEQAVSAKRLMIELTETAAISDIQDAQRFIRSLRNTGCRICLDDFGSGFSSFAYLKHLQVDVLKIDGMFIRDLTNDHDNQVFVRSIVSVANGMQKLTVAEFVEDRESLQLLTEMGVDMVQGYYMDHPTHAHPVFKAA